MTEAFSAALAAIGYFESSPHLAVAVSGGADSMALALLAQAWAKARGGRITALTVDHGLRAESAQEAQWVHEWCEARGMEHHVLSPLSYGRGGIQERAREARYALLTDWCREHGVLHLLTAHTQGDQAETLLFRLGRGSGLDGLAAMSAVSQKQGIRLLRPLLAFSKTQLQAFLTERDERWIEDPSNRDERFSRVRIRERLSPEAEEAAAALADRLGKIRHHLETQSAKRLAECVEIFAPGQAALKSEPWQRMEKEYALRVLLAVTRTVGGEPLPPRTEKLERLWDDLHGLIAGGKASRRTFAHCLIQYRPKERRFFITREHLEKSAPAPHIFSAPKPLAGAAFFSLNG